METQVGLGSIPGASPHRPPAPPSPPVSRRLGPPEPLRGLTLSWDLETFPLFSTSRAVNAYQMDLSSSARRSMAAGGRGRGGSAGAEDPVAGSRRPRGAAAPPAGRAPERPRTAGPGLWAPPAPRAEREGAGRAIQGSQRRGEPLARPRDQRLSQREILSRPQPAASSSESEMRELELCLLRSSSPAGLGIGRHKAGEQRPSPLQPSWFCLFLACTNPFLCQLCRYSRKTNASQLGACAAAGFPAGLSQPKRLHGALCVSIAQKLPQGSGQAEAASSGLFFPAQTCWTCSQTPFLPSTLP